MFGRLFFVKPSCKFVFKNKNKCIRDKSKIIKTIGLHALPFAFYFLEPKLLINLATYDSMDSSKKSIARSSSTHKASIASVLKFLFNSTPRRKITKKLFYNGKYNIMQDK